METLHFTVQRFDDDGVYFVIRGTEIALVTDGKSYEEALTNLHEAVELYFEGDDLPELSRVEVSFEGSQAHA
jgi:predicted RNase H-like HicB family nuclease